MQSATWVLLPLLILQLYTCVAPVMSNFTASIILSILFGAFGITSAYMGYKVSMTDPIDARLKRHLVRQKRREEEELQRMNGLGEVVAERTKGNKKDGEEFEDIPDDDNETKFCWVCQTRVHLLSMHCKFCDKCVGHFDHHCQWLNTCVGAANYKYFFTTLVFLALFLSIHAAMSLDVIIKFFVEWASVKSNDANLTEPGPDSAKTTVYDRFTTVYGGTAALPLAIINLTFLAFVLFFAALILQLCIFHISLQRKQITTYEYIVRDNALKREKAKKQREIDEMRRLRLIEVRQGSGSFAQICLLRAGQYCLPCCDPIRRDLLQKKQRSSLPGVTPANNPYTTAKKDYLEESNEENMSKSTIAENNVRNEHGVETPTDIKHDNYDDEHISSSPCLPDYMDSGVLNDQDHQIDFIPVSELGPKGDKIQLSFLNEVRRSQQIPSHSEGFQLLQSKSDLDEEEGQSATSEFVYAGEYSQISKENGLPSFDVEDNGVMVNITSVESANCDTNGVSNHKDQLV